MTSITSNIASLADFSGGTTGDSVTDNTLFGGSGGNLITFDSTSISYNDGAVVPVSQLG
jgi:hypothetical protein